MFSSISQTTRTNSIDSIVPPPINRISLQQTPAVFAGENGSLLDGKTVIVL
jgi:hypothetical protein